MNCFQLMYQNLLSIDISNEQVLFFDLSYTLFICNTWPTQDTHYQYWLIAETIENNKNWRLQDMKNDC